MLGGLIFHAKQPRGEDLESGISACDLGALSQTGPRLKAPSFQSALDGGYGTEHTQHGQKIPT